MPCKRRVTKPHVKNEGGPLPKTDGTDIFGPDNTWEKLYAITRKYMLVRTYWHFTEDRQLVEDAASDGFLYVLEHWQHQRSSLTANLERNFMYAMRVARLRARQSYGVARKRGSTEMVRSGAEPWYIRPQDYGDWYVGIFGASTADTPEDALVQRDTQERVTAIVGKVMTDTEFGDSLTDLFEGRTERSAATRDGVSQKTINRRRAAALEHMRHVLIAHDLLEVS